jgi:hypothetical protein
MKKLCVMLMIVAMLAVMVPAFAQDGTPIKANAPVTGEITNEAFETFYTFAGTADQVIVVELAPVDLSGDLDYPQVNILSSEGSILASYSGFGRTIVATKLPADDTYTITATRQDGAAGTSLGEYILTVWVPQVLVVGETVQDSLTNTEADYFVVESADPFVLSFDRTGGDFNPALSISTISTDLGLLEVATLGGELVTGGSIELEPAFGTASDGVYVIDVAEALFDFNFEPVTADYTLTLTAAE